LAILVTESSRGDQTGHRSAYPTCYHLFCDNRARFRPV